MGKKRLKELTESAPKTYFGKLQPGTLVDTMTGKEKIEDVMMKQGDLHNFQLLFKDIGNTKESLTFVGFETDLILPPEKQVTFLELCASICARMARETESGKLKWVSES